MGAAVAAVGLVGQAVGGAMAGKARKRAAEQQAQMKREQADELLRRAKRNAVSLIKERNILKGKQASGFAKAGVEMSGSALEVLNATDETYRQEVVNARQEAQFKANQLRRGADVDMKLASDIGKANIISTAGDVVAGSVGIAEQAGAFDKPKVDKLKLDVVDTTVGTSINPFDAGSVA